MSVHTLMTRANIKVLRDPRTFALGATVLLGDSTVVEDPNDCPTAYTDGVNKFYGDKFCAPLNIKQMVYLVLHENFHVLKMDVYRFKDLMKEDSQLANVAMDYVINGMIEGLNIWDMIERPPGALIDPKFKGWSVREVYKFLKTGQNKDGQNEGTPQPQDGDGNPMPQGGDEDEDEDEDEDDQDQDDGNGDEDEDEDKDKDKDEDEDEDDDSDGDGDGEGDDTSSELETDKPKPTQVKIGNKTYSVKEMDDHRSEQAAAQTPEEIKQLERQIQQVVEQATMMAGVTGSTVPLEIQEILAVKVDWKQVMDEFVINGLRGEDDMSFRRYDRRHVVDEHYMPTMINERIGELLLCMDTSGSTMGPVFGEFCGALASLLERCKPERVRILHWDTAVRHEQVLTEADYLGADLTTLLKPIGGGGTMIGSVSDHLIRNRVQADVCLIFTDGYIDDLRWAVSTPTLWLVTHNTTFVPPTGSVIKINK